MSCTYCEHGVRIPNIDGYGMEFRIFKNSNCLRAIAPNGMHSEVHANYCIVCGDKIKHETQYSRKHPTKNESSNKEKGKEDD